ncbi:hypothetical protein PUN28_020168 [Cardiocondyla obscurior]|uniref:Uncharacterized protein n=1 Tax=Cardiocondyla obscurior TaxID=286306 RepID=A0AAW2E924_9HYME
MKVRGITSGGDHDTIFIHRRHYVNHDRDAVNFRTHSPLCAPLTCRYAIRDDGLTSAQRTRCDRTDSGS